MNNNQYHITAIQKCCHTAKPYATWLVRQLSESGLDVKYNGSVSARKEDHALLIGSGIKFAEKDGKKICPGLVMVQCYEKDKLQYTKWLVVGEELNQYKTILGLDKELKND